MPRGQEKKLIQSSFFFQGEITPLVQAYKISIPVLGKNYNKAVFWLNNEILIFYQMICKTLKLLKRQLAKMQKDKERYLKNRKEKKFLVFEN